MKPSKNSKLYNDNAEWRLINTGDRKWPVGLRSPQCKFEDLDECQKAEDAEGYIFREHDECQDYAKYEYALEDALRYVEGYGGYLNDQTRKD